MTKSLNILAAAIVFGSFAIGTTKASAVSLGVQLACATDYYAHCSKHDPDGPGVRACMRAAGPKLSNRCINALVGAGEVSKAEVDAKRAAMKSAAAK